MIDGVTEAVRAQFGRGIKSSCAGGFTLIEVAIVTIISGLLFTGIFDIYSRYVREQQARTTEENIQLSAGAVGSFQITGRYPCPSDRTLAKTNANYGTEVAANCNLGPTGLNLIPSPVPAGWLGACYTTGVGVVPNAGTNGVGGICAFRCAAATCGDGTGDNNNIVVIGGIPIKSINNTLKTAYSTNVILDGWGKQMDYVVTYKQTSTATYKDTIGAISVVDENGTATSGINNDAHYGIISHGPDGIGGYTSSGQMFQVCGSHVPQGWNTGDDQNCSNNAKFLAGLKNDSRTASHFDDRVYFVRSGQGALWNIIYGSSDVKNLNQGRVNVGTSADPLTSLGVADPNVGLFIGDPAGGTSGFLHVSNVSKAKALCRKNGTDCFDIKALTNAAGASQKIKCATGTAMTGIKTVGGVTQAVCVTPDFTPQAIQQTCPAGQWLVGLDSSGLIICQ